MVDSINITSKFETFSSFIPSSYDLFIKSIDFNDRFCECELQIGGIFKKVRAQLKFTSILPIISQIQFSADKKTFFDLNFDKIYEELAANVEKDTNRLIDKKSYVEHILNLEDSMGGNNICVYLPHSVQNKIANEVFVTFKIFFVFYFDSRQNKYLSNYTRNHNINELHNAINPDNLFNPVNPHIPQNFNHNHKNVNNNHNINLANPDINSLNPSNPHIPQNLTNNKNSNSLNNNNKIVNPVNPNMPPNSNNNKNINNCNNSINSINPAVNLTNPHIPQNLTNSSKNIENFNNSNNSSTTLNPINPFGGINQLTSINQLNSPSTSNFNQNFNNNLQKNVNNNLTKNLNNNLSQNINDARNDFNNYNNVRNDVNNSKNDFDSYYLKCFYTPSYFNSPSGGYKPCIWLPCLNRSLDSTKWNIKVAVPTDMICITNGEFVDILDSDSPFIKYWQFKVNHITNPGNIFISVGKFQQKILNSDINDMNNMNNFNISNFNPMNNVNLNSNNIQIQCYSTAKLLPYVDSTVDFLPHFISFFETNYGFSFPYTKIHILFLSRFHKFKVFGNLIVIPTSVLTKRENVLQRFKNYRIFGKIMVEMIFGTLILPNTIADLWLVAGLNKFIYFNFIKKYFGICEFYKYFNMEQKRACEYPTSSSEFVFYLTPHVFFGDIQGEGADNISIPNALHSWYISSHPKILSTKKLWKCFIARCGLSMLSIERMITSPHLLKVISKILSFSGIDSLRFNRPSTEFFFSSILNISGKDIYGQIIRNWLSVSRPLFLTVDYCFNRRKSCLEVTIHNEDYEIEQNIPVNISITVQEVDNVFEYSHQIRRDARKTTFEVSSHSSKSRRPTLLKRIPTEGGREIDINFLQNFKSASGILTFDSPVVFIRINMDLCTFFGRVRVNQSECAWIHQAYVESSPLGHLKAIKTLKSFPSEISVLVLTKLIKNKLCWYHVRAVAFDTLVTVYNKIRSEELIGLDKESNPINLFKSLFCFTNYIDLPKINDFSNIPIYLFQIRAFESLSKLKLITIKEGNKSHRYLAYEILRSFFEYNDNVSNIFSDCCYRSKLLRAIGDSLDHVPPENSDDACSFVVSESINSLKIDHLEKFPHYCVSIASIFNIFKLQKMRYLKFNGNFFEHYCSPGIDIKLRTKCIEILVQFIILAQSSEHYCFLLDMISCDPSWAIRFSCVSALQKHPLFQAKIPESLNSKINTEDLHKELLRVIEFCFSQPDSLSLFSELSELYNYIYGEVSF